MVKTIYLRTGLDQDGIPSREPYDFPEVADVVTPTQTDFVDKTSDAVFSFGNTDIHNNGVVVNLVDEVLDSGWSRSANTVTFTGDPEKVKGYVSINAPDSGASSHWARPKLRVLRGATTIAVLDDLVMQQTTAYDGDSTISGVFFDKNPPSNPSYTFEWFDKDARTSTLIPESFSRISLEAVIKVEVYTV